MQWRMHLTCGQCCPLLFCCVGADERDPTRMTPATWEEMADPADKYLQTVSLGA